MKLLALAAVLQASAQPAAPVLAFPEPGLDDPAAYRGYATRFYRDAAENVVQIYIAGTSGRVVHLWADAANESIGFTVRDTAGLAVSPVWAGEPALVGRNGNERTLEYALTLPARTVELGWFVLGSMRVERDFQYGEHHLRPFGSPPFRVEELSHLVTDVERLPGAERQRHLALLRAADVDELRARLDPTIEAGGRATVRVTQPSLDGKHRLRLELTVDTSAATLDVAGPTVRIRPRSSAPITLRVLIASDAPTLTPLKRTDIFNERFQAFLDRAQAAHDSAVQAGAPQDDARIVRHRRMQRQIAGVELLSSREKLMAGLPNFATYFGRDDILSALLMEPVWTPAMQEAVIAAVLRKLSPAGEVSHEESLGGQAIREHAVEYHRSVVFAIDRLQAGDRAASDSAFARARSLLENLDRTRENYAMVDDELQLPVLAARYLAAPDATSERKRRFLAEPAGSDDDTRLSALVRALAYVARITEPYAASPIATNLVSFPRLPDGRWAAGSWRDSGVGYAAGRFAFDVNAIWAPEALRAIQSIIAELDQLGYEREEVLSTVASLDGPLAGYLHQPASLDNAIATWDAAAAHFFVTLPHDTVRSRVNARLEALPAEQRDYWRRVADAHPPPAEGIRFSALALDSVGTPVPVVNTDPAMWLLLGDIAAAVERGDTTAEGALRELRAMLLHYPFGLYIERLGPVVANDAYADPRVWDAWIADAYHSPRVVWGREVNVILAGLARQIESARADGCTGRTPALDSFARNAHDILERITAAVDASGLAHNELWTYAIDGGQLEPVRFATSTDVQLWNLTDLAVRFQLDRLARCGASR